MKIRVKSKVMAGAISVGLLSGIGLAFANTDAGAALKSWYDVRFDSTLEAIDSDVTAYVDGLKPGLQNEYNGMKNGAETSINKKRDSEITAATGAINSAKASHIASVESTKAEIKEEMGLAFYNAFLDGYFEIERMGREAIASATTDLTAFTGEKGEEALTQVTSELTAAKETAVSELEKAIENAKAELNAELDKQQEINTRNLKNQVNWKIEDVRKEIKGILNGLVTTQTGLITAKASELQTEAIAALDAVVSSINE